MPASARFAGGIDVNQVSFLAFLGAGIGRGRFLGFAFAAISRAALGEDPWAKVRA